MVNQSQTSKRYHLKASSPYNLIMRHDSLEFSQPLVSTQKHVSTNTPLSQKHMEQVLNIFFKAVSPVQKTVRWAQKVKIAIFAADSPSSLFHQCEHVLKNNENPISKPSIEPKTMSQEAHHATTISGEPPPSTRNKIELDTTYQRPTDKLSEIELNTSKNHQPVFNVGKVDNASNHSPTKALTPSIIFAQAAETESLDEFITNPPINNKQREHNYTEKSKADDALPFPQFFKSVDDIWDSSVETTASVILAGYKFTRSFMPW
jgi:hypothetical protein